MPRAIGLHKGNGIMGENAKNVFDSRAQIDIIEEVKVVQIKGIRHRVFAGF
jgi:hypothetical protein